MQACRVLRNSSALTPQTVARTISLSLPTTIHARTRGTPGRLLANAAVSEPKDSYQLELASIRERVFILLQKTASLVPQALFEHGAGPDSSLFWSNILERSITELSSTSDRVPSKATIAICGFDKWACSHDLVTALLEDPFTSEPTYSEILRDRWKDTPSYVDIEYGRPTAFGGKLSSPSNWLQRFPHAIRLTELSDLSSSPSTNNEADSLLLDSDVLLLLCDPVVTPFSELAARARHLLNRPSTILILTSGSVSDPHRQFASRTLSDMECQPGHILFVNPRQALDAVIALQANPTSPSTIDRYQRDTLGSGISAVTVAIDEVLRPKNVSETPLIDLRQETVLSHVHGSLSASSRSLEANKKDMDDVAGEVHDLSSRVERIRENARQDILGKTNEDDKIEKALSLGTKGMNALLESLSFWRMIWRVDEIGTLVSTAVQGQWCKGLENQLILQTGRLESTEKELTIAASSLLSAAPTSLRSPVLENQLQQLKCSPARVLTPNSLLQPIYDRRNQLVRYTTEKLHREAQSAVVGAFGGVLSGAGLGWWLAFGEHIVSLGAGTEIGTAIGSGALLAMSSIRWAVGKWERAKRRWAQDSVRVGEGLTRDLHRTIQQVVDENVTIVASTACKGLQALIDRRRDEIHRLHGELSSLDAELHACAQFPASWKRQGPRPTKE